MLKAKDIMTKEVVSLRRDTPVEEALKLLVEKKITGIPVVEEDMTLVGIVTEKDLLGLFYGPEGGKKRPVEDFMTRPAVHFDENDNLDEVCECLLKVTFRRAPVTRKGKVVGIVSRSDVLKCILEGTAREEIVQDD
ncbi:MAG: CBS domain-containing protein [Planctomycetota bacterium]|jgi:CBS domain-containing protein